MIQKRERTDLYDKFRQGAIPSGADFADLIRSQLNLMDDGIDVSEDPKDPVCLKAHGGNDNFLDFAAGNGAKKWRISGRCEDATKEGLNITAEEQSRFYIERETGNIGVNTDKPGAKFHIIQTGATDTLRIDDEGGDQTPLVVNSTGQVGIGTGNPLAELHVSYSGSGDILRVDDKDTDDTPFIINETGNVGIGFEKPRPQLAVNGKVSIGANEDRKDMALYVDGNIEVTGSVVFSGDEGLQLNAPLTSGTEELIIMDNLKVMGDPQQDDSKGNLSVAGNTTLGTYNMDSIKQNVVTINGRIESGGRDSEVQETLVINKTLFLNKNTLQATISGDLTVNGNTTLGNHQADEIALNGTIQTDVSMNKNLTVANNATIEKVLTVDGDANFKQNIILDGNIEVKGSLIGGFPIGTILMYDGSGWQDNVTIPGWYAMIADNAQYGCHDMINRFIMGKAPNAASQTGGENTHTLTIAEMPSHTHSISHKHGDTGDISQSHHHRYEHFYGSRQDWKSDSWGGGWVGYLNTISTDFNNQGHTHWISDYFGSSGSMGDGIAHENRPQYYSVLYIRRCR